MKMYKFVLVVVAALGLLTACAPEKKTDVGEMTGARMAGLIQKIDEAAEVSGNVISFKVKKREMVLVYDSNADRVRIMRPVTSASGVSGEVYKRMLQANYDAVLDPRYAIANDLVWAVYMHPLGQLSDGELLSAIAQVYTTAETFGSGYSSGAFVFGGGDSNALHQELLKELEDATKTKDKDI
ncbi:MAG: hypothetical protein JKY25_10045 [Robiginitomaculum sp.]|nr:hypothetical protein [Robiginitomaculum sp.]